MDFSETPRVLLCVKVALCRFVFTFPERRILSACRIINHYTQQMAKLPVLVTALADGVLLLPHLHPLHRHYAAALSSALSLLYRHIAATDARERI